MPENAVDTSLYLKKIHLCNNIKKNPTHFTNKTTHFNYCISFILSLSSLDTFLLGTRGRSRAECFDHWYITPQGFPGDTMLNNPRANTGDTGSIPGSGRCPGLGNGNPLQYSCLENSWTEEPGGL